jgi:hypothetical protein
MSNNNGEILGEICSGIPLFHLLFFLPYYCFFLTEKGAASKYVYRISLCIAERFRENIKRKREKLKKDLGDQSCSLLLIPY